MANRKFLLIAALFMAACVSDPMEEQPAEKGAPETIPAQKIVNASVNAEQGTLLVYFDEEAVGQIETQTQIAARTRAAVTRSGVANIDEVLGALEVTSLRRIFPYNAKSEQRARAAGLHKWYVVGFDVEADLNEAAQQLAAISEVEHIQFNTKLQKSDGFKPTPLRASAASTTTPIVTPAFNDPDLWRQWHYVNYGNTGIAATSRAGADINANEAWKLTAGDPSVIVAIVDQGVKYTHPDLAANMWVNDAEKSGSIGADDDQNGYMDDQHGYNFVTGGPVSWDVSHYDKDGVYDGDSGHGTHVAGTVAAVNNNGMGVCGVAGGTGNNDGVKIMSCQIFSGDKGGSAAVTAEAIFYAANNGASIIQCSFGYKAETFTSDDAYVSRGRVEKEAIDFFIKTKNCPAIDGGLVIFSAGNDEANMSGYPGAYRDYISVTSFSPDFLPAYYTNYGPGCNIAAPGGDYKISADKESSNVLSTVPSELADFAGSDYGFMQGTSMACPHVSGVAALGLSYALKKGKSFSLDAFKTMLFTSVNDINYYLEGSKDGVSLNRYYGMMGTGAIDAYQLLMQVEGTPCMRAKVGAEQLLALTAHFGGGASTLTYTGVSMTQADMDKLGIAEAPKIVSGKLKIKCTKPGTAKIVISAIAGGGNLGSGSSMGGQAIKKDIAIVARATENTNGGWL